MRRPNPAGSVLPSRRAPLGRAALLLAAIAALGGTVRAQHPYDTPQTAYPVFNGLNGLFTNAGSAQAPDWPVPCSPFASHDVWFVHVVDGPGATRVIRTCPPNGDTSTLPDSVLEVFWLSSFPIPGSFVPIPVECNDDSCGERSSVTVSGLAPGQPLLIRVASPPSPTFPFPPIVGTFRLEVTGGPAPPNNNCSGAIPLGNAAGTFENLTNLFATLTSGVPSFCAATVADVWYTWVAPCSGTATFRTCGSSGALADTVLQVLTGTCGSLTALGCNDDGCGLHSSVTVPVVAGQTYYVRVGDFAYAGFQNFYNWGTFDLNVTYSGGAGTVASIPTACGNLPFLASSGSPTPGGSLTYEIYGGNLIWLGIPTFLPLCPPQDCLLGASLLLVLPGDTFTGSIPCDPGLVGVTFAVQGADLTPTGGCPGSAYGISFSVTDTIVTTIG